MKKRLLSSACLLASAIVSAQNVGIGVASFTPETGALLELRSTTSGFLMPRMTDAQMAAIPGPTEGLLVYQTNATEGFKYYDGTVWTSFGGGGADNLGDHTAGQNIRLTDFWLSNDGGNEGIRVTNDGKVGIGLSDPSKELDVNGHMRLGGLAGLGSRMMVVDNGGNVSAQELPAAPLWSTNGVDVYRTSGTVGLGTSSPLTNLDLYGNGTSGFVLGGTSTVPNPAEGPEIGFGRGGFSNPGASIQMIDYDSYSAGLAFIVKRGLANSAGGVFANNFPSDAIQAMTILNNGQVGIGTSDPSAKLEVNGDVRITDLAGSGTRMVVADAQGDLSTQALPTSGSTPTTVFATTDASINPASYNAGAVSGMSISSVAAGSYVVSFNADITRGGSTACQCVVRAGGTDDSSTERSMEIPAAKSEFHLMGKVTLASSGTIEIRCKKNSGGAGFTVGKRAMSIQATN